MEPISLAKSLRIVHESAATLKPKSENISTRTALGRVLFRAIAAQRLHPAVPLAAMDGIAVNFRSTFVLPARLKQDQWQRINTGEAVPSRFNAVVRIEDVSWDEQIPVLSREVMFLQNVRARGEDFGESKLLFPAGHILQPQDLTLLLAAGYDEIPVHGKPVISFIPTGSELVQHNAAVAEGKILESNSAIIKGLVETWGGELRISDPVPDDPDDLAQIIKLGLAESAIVVVSAGTSKGTADLTEKVVGLMGNILFHGVKIHPAKPVLFGLADSKPIIGLPGYPVSAYVASLLFLRPLVCALSGLSDNPRHATFVSAEEIAARESDAFYRVQTFDVDGQTYVRHISKGASSLFSLSEMDGLMHVPPNTAIRKRDGVRVDIIRDRSQNCLAVTGFGDADIEYLFDLVRQEMPAHRLLFWEGSNEEALNSIAERNSHFAVIAAAKSLPDPFPQFQRQLQEPMKRIRVFTRSIGIITAPEADFASLPRPVILALPKRNESLWEELLAQMTWNYTDIQTIPTESEEDSLAEAILAGHWQAVFSDLRFAKNDQRVERTVQQHVDLIIPESVLETPAIKKLLEMLNSDAFRKHMKQARGVELP